MSVVRHDSLELCGGNSLKSICTLADPLGLPPHSLLLFATVLISDLESFYQERTVDKLQSLALNLEPNKNEKKTIFYLDGNTLKPDDLFELGLGKHKIDVSDVNRRQIEF